MTSRLLLLLLLAGLVAGQEPSLDFCEGFCSQADARQREDCERCPGSELTTVPPPPDQRGDMRNPEYIDEYYDYNTDVEVGGN